MARGKRKTAKEMARGKRKTAKEMARGKWQTAESFFLGANCCKFGGALCRNRGQLAFFKTIFFIPTFAIFPLPLAILFGQTAASSAERFAETEGSLLF